MILGFKTQKGGSAMKKFIKTALAWLERVSDVSDLLAKTGKELVDLFDENDDD